MEDLKKVLTEISSNRKLAEEFKNLKSTEEFIKFCASLGVKVTEEELNKLVISKLSKAKEMNDDELELIAGGRMDFRKIQSLVLAATTFMGVGASMVPSTFAVPSSGKICKVVSVSQEELDKQFEAAAEADDLLKCEKLLSQGARITRSSLNIIYDELNPKEDIIKMIIEKYGHVPNQHQLRILLELDVNTDTIKSLVKNGFELDEYTLICACSLNKVDIAKYVMENGIKPFPVMLEIACMDGNAEVSKILMDYGIEPTKTALKFACFSDNIELVELLIKNGVILPDDILTETCHSHGLNMAKFLVEKGIKPTNETLEKFIRSSHSYLDKDVLNFLLENGAEPTDKALENACGSSWLTVEMIESFMEKGAKPTDEALENACNYFMEFDIIKLLIEKGAKPTSKALEEACSSVKCSKDIIELLIEKGAKPTDKALINACGNKYLNLDAINLLASKGLELNNNTEALEAACWGENVEAAELLVKHGAKPTEEMLEYACHIESKSMIKFLIKNKVKTTFNSILRASFHDDIDDSINTLIDNDFDLTSKNEANQNILMYLINNINFDWWYRVNPKVFNILLDRNVYSKEEITEALKFAQEKSREDVAKIFSEKLESMK